MSRAYYSAAIENFIKADKDKILGILCANNQFDLTDLQRNTWQEEILILKKSLINLDGYIAFEYTIPRIGNRIDIVILHKGLIFLLEFKVGEKNYSGFAIDQVTDYALDLQNFHKESHDRLIVPIIVSTKAEDRIFKSSFMKSKIFNVLCCNESNIREAICSITATWTGIYLEPHLWLTSQYTPTPTIIEAAQALYRNHTVIDISRNDASAINLSKTTQAINNIIEDAKANHKKAICFVTGVPGAGKTLAGLNIAIERQKADENEHAVFLSGNGPLVDVLQEALAHDQVERNNIKKSDALRKSREFIQIFHKYRDDIIATDDAPIEKVTVFDEAQRAWTEDMLSKFMAQKKGKVNFNRSEPQFLIEVIDRHNDWAVLVCLIGGGQEINTGEAGLLEWFSSLRQFFPHWHVYVSKKITDSEYIRNESFIDIFEGLDCEFVEDLHLAVSIRSFRSENVASFVKALLDVNIENAKTYYQALKNDYPIYLTRDLTKAKKWIKSQAKGTERYGLTASSGARRLRTEGVWVQSKIDAKHWFLNKKDDVRSSYHLEEAATEFDIQGLELDWTIICWDANLRFSDDKFTYHSFKGSKWQNIHKEEDQIYLKNAYRVLLTRARQGFVIFIPNGNDNDKTRLPNFYNSIYNYLKNLNIPEL